jgi:hypothetical protein
MITSSAAQLAVTAAVYPKIGRACGSPTPVWTLSLFWDFVGLGLHLTPMC